MTKQEKTNWKVVGIIVGIIAVAFGVQYARFYSGMSKITKGDVGTTIKFDNSYFPFNHQYKKDESGKIVRA